VSLRSHCLACLFLPAFLLCGARPAPAQEAYFLLMFGSQRTPPDPDHSHSFATFVRVRYNGGPQPGVPVIEAHTISWLPSNLDIRLLALLPEPGHNFDLHTTLRFVLGDRQRVSLWGPYQIDPTLYFAALRQIRLLESGQVRYKAVDSGYPTDVASNCIHAIGSVVEGYRVRIFSPGWGETASFNLLERFRPWIIDDSRTHPWVAYALGLNYYPIVYRSFEHPRSGFFRGATSRLFGRDREVIASYGPPLR
jgi:hypothetical protein